MVTLLSGQDLLYKVVVFDSPGRERLPHLALVLPKVLVATVLVSVHAELAHAGRDAMLATIKKQLHWKKMTRNIAVFVQSCQLCKLKAVKADVLKSVSVKTPLGPGKRLAIDLWTTDNGNVIVLTAMCLHSQYPFAEMLPDKTSVSVVDKLANILMQLAHPIEIVCDNGPEFTSQHFKEYCRQRHLRIIYTAPYHPQSNGVLERFHRYLNAVVRRTAWLATNPDMWPAIRAAVEAYRKTPHSSAGESPTFLFNRQEPLYSIDHLLPTCSREFWDSEGNQWNLAELKVAHGIARKNVALQRLRNARAGPARSEIKVGNRVYVKKHGTRNKLDLVWEPGFRVTGLPTSRQVEVEDTSTGQSKKRLDIRDVKRADPVSELLANSSIDTLPGRSQNVLSQQRSTRPPVGCPG